MKKKRELPIKISKNKYRNIHGVLISQNFRKFTLKIKMQMENKIK